MNSKTVRALAASAGMACAGIAQAASVTFFLVNSGTPGGGFQAGAIEFTGSDGITKVRASATSTGAPSQTSYIDSSTFGLLVCTGTRAPTGSCGFSYPDEHWVDSNGVDESIIFDFGAQNVRLLSATFHSNWSGALDLGVDGGLAVDELALANSLSFGAGYAGRSLRFGADTTTKCRTVRGKRQCSNTEDYFKITSITVDVPGGGQVPVPGTLGLLGLGLIGLGTLRKDSAAD
jgi:PEP-CTERM motif